MPPNKSKTSIITSLNEVGRYAIGVRWADGHDSIYPLESLAADARVRHAAERSGRDTAREPAAFAAISPGRAGRIPGMD